MEQTIIFKRNLYAPAVLSFSLLALFTFYFVSLEGVRHLRVFLLQTITYHSLISIFKWRILKICNIIFILALTDDNRKEYTKCYQLIKKIAIAVDIVTWIRISSINRQFLGFKYGDLGTSRKLNPISPFLKCL